MKLWTFSVYLLARAEVAWSLRGSDMRASPESSDRLDPAQIPSVRGNPAGGLQDRVLAEMDQDGFLFAVDPRDKPLFNRRQHFVPRKHHRIQIVLTGGKILLRKTRIPAVKGVGGRLGEWLKWDLYLEAASLLRLRRSEGFPRLHRIDRREALIEMDFIWGADVRGGDLPREATSLLDRAVRRGIIPRDVHAANFVRAHASGKLYLVDFNLVHLWPIPGWRRHLRALEVLLPPGKSGDPVTEAEDGLAAIAPFRRAVTAGAIGGKEQRS